MTRTSALPRPTALLLAAALLPLATVPAGAAAQETPAAERRPMTFLDAQNMRGGGSWTPSPDGRWMLYTVSEPDWEEAERQSDIHLVSLEEGLSSSRQMTYTEETSERSPAWPGTGASSRSCRIGTTRTARST